MQTVATIVAFLVILFFVGIALDAARDKPPADRDQRGK
jgi:hypothetical protein